MAVRCVIWNQALKTYRRGITIVVHACRRIYHFIRAVMSCSKVREVAYSEEQPVRVLSVRPISSVHSSRLRYSISIDNLPGSVGETDTRERILVERRQIGNRFCTPHRNRRPPNLPTLLALLQALEMYENPSEVREDSSSQEVKTVISENPGGDKGTLENKEKKTSNTSLAIVKKESKKDEEELDVWDVESLETLTDKDEEIL